MRQEIIFSNRFHNTESRVIVDVINGKAKTTRGQFLKINRELCGMSGCGCSAFISASSEDGVSFEVDSYDSFCNNGGYELTKKVIMNKKKWAAPSSEEVAAIVDQLGGINPTARMIRKSRDSVYRWVHGKAKIDFANWKLIQELSGNVDG